MNTRETTRRNHVLGSVIGSVFKTLDKYIEEERRSPLCRTIESIRISDAKQFNEWFPLVTNVNRIFTYQVSLGTGNKYERMTLIHYAILTGRVHSEFFLPLLERGADVNTTITYPGNNMHEETCLWNLIKCPYASFGNVVLLLKYGMSWNHYERTMLGRTVDDFCNEYRKSWMIYIERYLRCLALFQIKKVPYNLFVSTCRFL